MLLDNKNTEKKVHQWLEEYTERGEIDVVTGYFTVGALARLSRHLNEKITAFRMVLGDIVDTDLIEDRPLDLLGENVSIEGALHLSSAAKEAVAFLRQEKVAAKTLEPNFCHAKLYLFNHQHEERHHYFVSGSSNLTEAGIGLKATHNVELNLAETGDNLQYRELLTWFENLWKSKEAHKDKTIIGADGTKTKIPFKAYLIQAIEKFFKEYSPKEIYYKVLFELFGEQVLADEDNPEFNFQVGRLQNTVIYQSLYDFQKKGVLSLISKLQRYGGAILADAVGLGKTWSALAVMKFFQLQGREVILICPKKLQLNWHRYRQHQEGKFEKDQLDFFIRFHTDMQVERMERYPDRADKLFVNDKPKLFVIDESHNLRNAKSQRYNFLVNEILQKNEDVKVLLLSATPINNTFLDIRNQFKLIKQGWSDGFQASHSIKNIDHLFRKAQEAFREWSESGSQQIKDFRKHLPGNFFKLTDSLVVARTRAMVEKHEPSLSFPQKGRPKNLFVTSRHLGDYQSFEDLFDNFPPCLSAYQPAFYIEQEEQVPTIHDEKQRDRFLVQMMYILLVKRLESSWLSFHSTIKKILDYHQQTLDQISGYMERKEQQHVDLEATLEGVPFDEEEREELAEGLNSFTLGKKRPISISTIDKAGKLIAFKADLEKDIRALKDLNLNLEKFEGDIRAETAGENKGPDTYLSKDEKLQSLMQEIRDKQRSGKNRNNQKVLIFTVYKDTAFYLFEELRKRGFKRLAVVSGDVSKTDTAEHSTKLFEPILERFAPFTKLFTEKEWDFIPSQPDLSPATQYREWVEWVKVHDVNTHQKLEAPLDLLIATDVLSEGQNLQDCDMVINYDIHWNPVRVIQRMGRIDRLGSPNEEVFGINYWPSDNINSYLKLKKRVEEKMALMKLAGSEVQLEFTDSFKEMAEDQLFEAKRNERMLEQMEAASWEDIEEHESGLGFDNLTFEEFRQDLLGELKERGRVYKNMPNGVYSGFIADKAVCRKKGIIALLRAPARPTQTLKHKYQRYHLLYLDGKGRQIIADDKEVLEALSRHQDQERFVPAGVDRGEAAALSPLVTSIKLWLKAQVIQEERQEDGTVKELAGTETKGILRGIKAGEGEAIRRIKENVRVGDDQAQGFDLIAWFLVG